MSEQQAHISRVHLKGYKSIKDLEIDLLPGLNIVIGPNGSGKSNFQDFLKKIVNERFVDIKANNFECSYDVQFNSNLTLTNHYFAKEVLNSRLRSEKHITKVFLKNNLEIRQTEFKVKGNILQFLVTNAINFNEGDVNGFTYLLESINFSDPNTSYLNNPLSIEIEEFSEDKSFSYESTFESETLIKIIDEEQLYKKTLKKLPLVTRIQVDERLKENLALYSPIKDMKIDNKLFRITENSEERKIENIIAEFFVNNNWFLFDSLSDGTKRLFYIISTVLFEKNTIIIEEPELGIHPDQLQKLMEFLKEQSKEKQIIITTHSPQVLNILQFEEFNRIVATKYDSKKGTIMKRLDKNKMASVIANMQDIGVWLSDYWLYHNLENDIYETGKTEEN